MAILPFKPIKLKTPREASRPFPREIRSISAARDFVKLHVESDPAKRGQAHLRRILGKYAVYYNEPRIHRSLDKDAPFHRAIERLGVIKSQPVLSGLHHQYCRI